MKATIHELAAKLYASIHPDGSPLRATLSDLATTYVCQADEIEEVLKNEVISGRLSISTLTGVRVKPTKKEVSAAIKAGPFQISNKLNPGALIQCSNHVHADVKALYKMACKVLGHRASDLAEKDAFIHEFVRAFRALFDFLCNGRRKPDDFVAVDFFADAENWRDQLQSMDQAEIQYLKVLADERAGGEVMHLTAKRLEPGAPNKSWPIMRIIRAIEPIIRDFERSHQPRGDDWDSYPFSELILEFEEVNAEFPPPSSGPVTPLHTAELTSCTTGLCCIQRSNW